MVFPRAEPEVKPSSRGETLRELSNEYQHDRIYIFFQKSLRPCALDESILSIGRLNSAVDSLVAKSLKSCLPI